MLTALLLIVLALEELVLITLVLIALAWLCLVMLNYLFHAAAARGTAFSTAD